MRKLAVSVPLACTLALAVTTAASAATVAPNTYDAGNFSANSGVSTVTGTVYFDSATSFHITNAKLSDTACGDNRAAQFRVVAYDLTGREIDYPWHSLINDCASAVIWTNLSGSASSGYIKYLKIQTAACQGGITDSCSSSGYSANYSDSYS